MTANNLIRQFKIYHKICTVFFNVKDNQFKMQFIYDT